MSRLMLPDQIKSMLSRHEPAPLDVSDYYAVCLPLVYLDGEWHILFESRAKGISQAGDTSFPGGRVDDGERFEEAALRELEEEIGVDAKRIHVLGEMDYAIMGKRLIACFVCVLAIDDLNDLRLNTNEVAHVFTIPLEELAATDIHHYEFDTELIIDETFPFDKIPGGKDYPFSAKQRPATVPFYRLEGEVLWGLTARLTERFIQLLQADKILLDEGK